MDQLREFIGLFRRQHFWFVAPTILVLALGGWWLGVQQIEKEFQDNLDKVTKGFAAVTQVRDQVPHPNDVYHDEMDRLIGQRRVDVSNAWKVKWERQKQLEWSPDLLDDFRRIVVQLRHIEKVDPDKPPASGLNQILRSSYARFVKDELPRLAASIGSKWQPSGQGIRSGPSGPERSVGRSVEAGLGAEDESLIVRWNPQNQADIQNNHFPWLADFTVPPTTLEILYAQEDLWVLQSLMQIIKNTNGSAMTRPQADIKDIEFIHIGKDVQPQAFRVHRPGPIGDSTGAAADNEPAPVHSPEEQETRGLPASGESPLGEEGTGAADPYVNHPATNRYVDKNYQPVPVQTLLSAAENTNPDEAYLAVAKRIPVRVRFVMDQRAINKLLVECANSALTLEVRQLRYNPQDQVGRGYERSSELRAEWGSGPSSSGRENPSFFSAPFGQADQIAEEFRTFDRTIEIYGIVYIFNPVDESKLGGEQAAPAETLAKAEG